MVAGQEDKYPTRRSVKKGGVGEGIRAKEE
jgi:hypothetical protein